MPLLPDKEQLSSLSISKIKSIIETIEPDDTAITLLKNDPRTGLQALARRLEKRKRLVERLKERQRDVEKIEKFYLKI